MQVIERSNQSSSEQKNPVSELAEGDAEKEQDKAREKQQKQDSQCKRHKLSDLIENESEECSYSAHKPPHP